MTRAFLTGSRVYGTPREDSDTDLAVLMSQEDLELLRKATGAAGSVSGQTAASDSLRFGSLNIIAFVSEEQFIGWREATECLRIIAPVTREQAVDLIRHKCGLPPIKKKESDDSGPPPL